MNEEKLAQWVQSLFLALDELRDLLSEISEKLDGLPDREAAWWE